MALLELKNVGKVYRQTRAGFFRGVKQLRDRKIIEALNSVSLIVEAGDAIGIVGESGAGKTTIARLAAGLETPSSGSVKVNGSVLAGGRGDARKRAHEVQMIWQDAPGSLDPRMKVEKIIAEPLVIHGLRSRREKQNRATDLLKEVGLEADLEGRYPHELSGGQAQRVAIARALALSPKLLVCDEPASALDAHGRARLADLLARLRQERKLALLIIAHDLTLVRRLAEQLIVLRQGSVVERGPTYEVLTRPEHPYTRSLVDAEPVLVKSGPSRRPVTSGGDKQSQG